MFDTDFRSPALDVCSELGDASRNSNAANWTSGADQGELVIYSEDKNLTATDVSDKVCYGTICSIPIRFIGNAQGIVQGIIPFRAHSEEFVLLKIALHETRAELETFDSRPIALLDTATYQVLTGLRAIGSVSFQTFHRRLSLGEKGGDSGKTKSQLKKVTVRKPKKLIKSTVEINLYGLKEQGNAVGMFLSQRKVFLQDPILIQRNMLYDNPHLLDLPDHVYEDNTTGALDKEMEKLDDSTYSSDELLRSDPNALLDKFAPSHHLKEVAVDIRIRTPLLGHQRKAIDFMMRREGLVKYHDSESLWEKICTDTGDSCFRHRITGNKSSDSNESRGGLLADEMGLGKSLTVIATIAASLNHVPLLLQGMMAEYDPISDGPIPTSDKPVPTVSTLIVVPSALLIDSWIDEINRHVHPCDFTFYKYHRFKRNIPWSVLLQYKVVLTTYGTVESELRRDSGILHKVMWFRLVLDEAHLVRNKSTKQFGAVNALKARIRWCLTGTPIQNSLDDLGTLIKFLKVPMLDDEKQFRRHIIKPCEPKNKSSFKNLQTLLGYVCLRRKRDILNLPLELERKHSLEFSDDEAAEYQRINEDFNSVLASFVKGASVKKDLTRIFEVILRLRIFCNNSSYLGPSSSLAMTCEELKENLLQQSDEAACHNCGSAVLRLSKMIESPDSGFITSCERVLCSDCSAQYYEQSMAFNRCSLCDQEHEIVRENHELQEDGVRSASHRYPTKILAVRDELEAGSVSTKSIVFSFWRKSLDILGEVLHGSGIHYLRIDGTSPLDARKKTLEEFKSVTGKSTLLITFGIGAVGLNDLSVANRIHILEPQWNPYVESQAIGRLLRLGQQQQVQINRYIIRETIEINVQTQQIRKLRLAEGGFDKMQTIEAREEIATRLKNLANGI